MLVEILGNVEIQELPIPYAAVACDIDSGETVVLREGPLVDAVRASTAIPVCSGRSGGTGASSSTEGWSTRAVTTCRALGATS